MHEMLFPRRLPLNTWGSHPILQLQLYLGSQAFREEWIARSAQRNWTCISIATVIFLKALLKTCLLSEICIRSAGMFSFISSLSSTEFLRPKDLFKSVLLNGIRF